MAIFNKTVYLPPQLISYEDTRYYLQVNSSGCLLYNEHSSSPLYQLHEPLLLIQGMAANTQQIHLVMIKANGNLCYTLINGSEHNQTTVLAKLDVRSTRYRRLLLFPLGKTIHIFYAYAHQAIPDLWRIEHRFWNGKTWRSVNLGEVVHSREPLYDIVLDQGGNLHLLMMTFQGRQTIILTNRFNGSFYLWGNTSQAFQIQQEVMDITSIITPDNIHHLFWLAKTPGGKFDLGWAYRSNVQDIAGNWLRAPAALQTLNGPVKGLGAIEINGGLWLLVNAEVETLLFYKGDGWKQVISNTPTHRHLRYVRKNNSSYYNAYWLEESHDSRTPAYHQYLGLNLTSMSTHAGRSPNIPPISAPPTVTQIPAYPQTATANQASFTYTASAARTFPQANCPIKPQPLEQSAYNTVQSPVAMSISTSPVISQTPTENVLPSNQSPQAGLTQLDLPKAQIQNLPDENTSQISCPLPDKVPDANSPGQSTLDLPQIESANQPQIDYNLQFAYTDYPDDLIPPAPEISSAALPSLLPANIDQPVFATQLSEENILEDNTDLTTMPDSLPVFAPAKVSLPEPKILADSNESLNQVLAPIITNTLDPVLKTIVELESQVTKIQKEKDQSYQIIEQQLSELQQERKATLDKIENYFYQIDSQKDNTFHKLEQQLLKLQQEEQINNQKIEQLISSIQLDKEEAQKHEKGFWARWFK